MITLAIAGILLMLGVPAMNELVRSNRLTTEANQFVTALHTARAEAARLRGPVSLRPTAGVAGWHSRGGYELLAEPRPFQDIDRDGNFLGADEMLPASVLQSFPPVSAATRIVASDLTVQQVTFLPNGMLQTRALQLHLCDEASPECRRVAVSPAGRISATRFKRADAPPEGTP